MLHLKQSKKIVMIERMVREMASINIFSNLCDIFQVLLPDLSWTKYAINELTKTVLEPEAKYHWETKGSDIFNIHQSRMYQYLT